MSHLLDQGRRRFKALIECAPPAETSLPLVHSTDVLSIANIIDDQGKIRTQECEVFSPERLTYLFYGRPIYRPNSEELPNDLEHYFPVCFIFKLNASIIIKRTFPFDSGAFQRGMYGSFLHKRMRLGDFLLENAPDTPSRIVKKFFSDNTNYMIGHPEIVDEIDASEVEAKSYEALISFKGANSLDGRGGGIEIQTDEIIDILTHVEAVILPSSQAKSKIGTYLRQNGIETIPYRPPWKNSP